MYGCMSYLRFVQLLKKGLPTRQAWTKISLVSAQVVLMTELTDFEPLAKRLKVGDRSPTSPSASLKGSLLCSKKKDNSTVDEEKGQNNTEIKMDTQPKTGAGGLRRVKTNASHQKVGPRQQQKFRATLDQWLVKPRKTQNTEEVCQIEDVVEMTDDSAFQSTSAQSQDKHTVSDTDEETQPLTPQDLDEDEPVSPGSKGSAETEPIQTLPTSDGGLDKEEMEICAASSEAVPNTVRK
ncbi:hypothetical protein INR49_005653 [Caranx melampygus]|nr:hypothetical protein INR49_005653 [Caranx melampygus]